MRNGARVEGNCNVDAPESAGNGRSALQANEQAAYDDLNHFLSGLVRRKAVAGGLETGGAAARRGCAAADAGRRARGWSVKVLGVSRLSEVAELCRALGAIPGIRAVRVTGLSADHIHLALATASTIDKPDIETLLASLSLAEPDATSFEVEESGWPGSRLSTRR